MFSNSGPSRLLYNRTVLSAEHKFVSLNLNYPVSKCPTFLSQIFSDCGDFCPSLLRRRWGTSSWRASSTKFGTVETVKWPSHQHGNCTHLQRELLQTIRRTHFVSGAYRGACEKIASISASCVVTKPAWACAMLSVKPSPNNHANGFLNNVRIFPSLII